MKLHRFSTFFLNEEASKIDDLMHAMVMKFRPNSIQKQQIKKFLESGIGREDVITNIAEILEISDAKFDAYEAFMKELLEPVKESQIEESYHDMKYDDRDMVVFGKFINTKPELNKLHKETLATVDGVTMDMLTTTYDKMMKEHPDMQKAFDAFAKKNEKKSKFGENVHLIIHTPYGDKYRVNNKGEMTQYKNDEFSGGWKLQAIVDSQFGRTALDFYDIDVKSLKDLKDRGLLYKNKNPKYTVRDLDHGTTRVWGNTKVHGIDSLYFEDANVKESVDEARKAVSGNMFPSQRGEQTPERKEYLNKKYGRTDREKKKHDEQERTGGVSFRNETAEAISKFANPKPNKDQASKIERVIDYYIQNEEDAELLSRMGKSKGTEGHYLTGADVIKDRSKNYMYIFRQILMNEPKVSDYEAWFDDLGLEEVVEGDKTRYGKKTNESATDRTAINDLGYGNPEELKKIIIGALHVLYAISPEGEKVLMDNLGDVMFSMKTREVEPDGRAIEEIAELLDADAKDVAYSIHNVLMTSPKLLK